jgi:hypothetical protein
MCSLLPAVSYIEVFTTTGFTVHKYRDYGHIVVTMRMSLLYYCIYTVYSNCECLWNQKKCSLL